MPVYVNTNYSALQGQRYLGNVQNSLTTTYQRLSSGLRINSAKDDAAGLQIADRLTSQINGLNQGNRNASDGIALAQTIESGMDEISGMLQKIRTLTVQAANGTNTKEDRAALSKEATALATEINRIATQTTFAGKTVLNGMGSSSIFGKDAAAGNGQNGGPGKAGKTGTMTLQVGSNKGDTISFDIDSVMFSKIAVEGGAGGKLIGADKIFKTDNNTGAVTVTFTKADFANAGADAYIGKVIELMDTAISKVDGMRAGLGALQNRLESSIRNQSNVAANEADARSRIRDADFAEESANLSQQSIIQQAAASMLMQANTRPQLGLSLLG
ncbi:MAG: flagellin [Anaerobiospirillum succiniciproducens]|uniref:flagellin N-terminal helical domain-containing protein n=1 Tax=Anaerobiospirillum succiniciproducens TaxID=13335 RepID=UPI0026DDA283|nr:flagellin [Anaerobiospirillum succiniciproducens]MDO4676058.1 flagellin [Anaerobiospirillum succiniciproducens]